MRNPQKWFAVTVTVPASDAEMASAKLYELGCNGIVEESGRLTAYFDGNKHDGRSLRAAIHSAFAPFPALAAARLQLRSERIADWDRRWKQHFKPFEIAPGVVVSPSWEHPRSGPNKTVIKLDPGMAFGTGLHPTTRLCAGLLAKIALENDPENYSLLDVGTGSGILAILAQKMGIKRIAAVDDDPDALRVARENFSKNGCRDVRLAADLRKVHGCFDIVVANILLSTLIELRPEISRKTTAGGWLILSGITHDQEADIEAAYKDSFANTVIHRAGEWSAFICRRRN